MKDSRSNKYYVPQSSPWPIFGSCVGVLMAVSIILILHNNVPAGYIGLLLSGVGLAVLFYGWTGDVSHESASGLYSSQLDRTFRLSMFWFIVTEVAFFCALLGALAYVRWYSIPLLSAQNGYAIFTQHFLYPHFSGGWPLLNNPQPNIFPGSQGFVSPWGLPLYNTLILALSALTLTQAHLCLEKAKRWQSFFWQMLTIFSGILFLYFQYQEYYHAMGHLGLYLSSGIYGSLFYFITGFHGLHVCIGTIFLSVIAVRTFKGHFEGQSHFAFEAASWYWHFVDVVWWFVFICVYCL